MDNGQWSIIESFSSLEIDKNDDRPTYRSAQVPAFEWEAAATDTCSRSRCTGDLEDFSWDLEEVQDGLLHMQSPMVQPPTPALTVSVTPHREDGGAGGVERRCH